MRRISNRLTFANVGSVIALVRARERSHREVGATGLEGGPKGRPV